MRKIVKIKAFIFLFVLLAMGLALHVNNVKFCGNIELFSIKQVAASENETAKIYIKVEYDTNHQTTYYTTPDGCPEGEVKNCAHSTYTHVVQCMSGGTQACIAGQYPIEFTIHGSCFEPL